jgi:hypothetical protein
LQPLLLHFLIIRIIEVFIAENAFVELCDSKDILIMHLRILFSALPHPLNTPTTDVCLFVKDLNRTKREYDDSVNFFKDLLAEKGVKTISNVSTVNDFKTKYPKKSGDTCYSHTVFNPAMCLCPPALANPCCVVRASRP